MSVSWELVVRWAADLPRRAVWLKQNWGVRCGASGVLDMTGPASLGRGGGEVGGCGSAFFQNMPARLLCWLVRDVSVGKHEIWRLCGRQSSKWSSAFVRRIADVTKTTTCAPLMLSHGLDI